MWLYRHLYENLSTPFSCLLLQSSIPSFPVSTTTRRYSTLISEGKGFWKSCLNPLQPIMWHFSSTSLFVFLFLFPPCEDGWIETVWVHMSNGIRSLLSDNMIWVCRNTKDWLLCVTERRSHCRKYVREGYSEERWKARRDSLLYLCSFYASLDLFIVNKSYQWSTGT